MKRKAFWLMASLIGAIVVMAVTTASFILVNQPKVPKSLLAKE